MEYCEVVFVCLNYLPFVHFIWYNQIQNRSIHYAPPHFVLTNHSCYYKSKSLTKVWHDKKAVSRTSMTNVNNICMYGKCVRACRPISADQGARLTCSTHAKQLLSWVGLDRSIVSVGTFCLRFCLATNVHTFMTDRIFMITYLRIQPCIILQ